MLVCVFAQSRGPSNRPFWDAAWEFAHKGKTTGEKDQFGLPVRYNGATEYRNWTIVVQAKNPIPKPGSTLDQAYVVRTYGVRTEGRRAEGWRAEGWRAEGWRTSSQIFKKMVDPWWIGAAECGGDKSF